MPYSQFISKEQQAAIAEIISNAEKNTSGEIRVHAELTCEIDVLDRAAYIFKKLCMHKTKERNGVLIYISIKDKKLAIIGDIGVNKIVSADFWVGIKDQMIAKFKDSSYFEGISIGIQLVANVLSEFFPYKSDDQNELSNEMTFGNTLKSLLFLVIFCFSFFTFAQFPEKPNPPRLVNDFAKMLSIEQQNEIERELVAFNDSTSTQIAIVTVLTIAGYDVSDYAIQLAEKWGIGDKNKDNGILILIKPRIENERGEVFIATGYGLEEVVPDIAAKTIIEREMIPEFKVGNNYAAIKKASKRLQELSLKKYPAADYVKGVKKSKEDSWAFLIIAFIIVIAIFYRQRKYRHSSLGRDLSLLSLFSLMNSGNSAGRGSWGDFSSGGGSFGGFGGGSFGGGGAGGSW